METKKIVDALILGGVLVVSLGSQTAVAAAANACDDGTAAAVAVGTFVQQAFTPKCSAGVNVSVNDAGPATAGVKGMSKKGMHSFGGDVNGGGAIKACEATSIAYTAPTASSTGC